MVKHLVFFKLSEEGMEQQDLIVEKLNNLKEEIDFVRALEVGVNFAEEERAFDIALTVIVDSKEALQDYASHEKHVEFVTFVKSLDTHTKVVDYEIEKEQPSKEFGNASIIKKANIYFEGNVTSRTVYESNGERKTLGIMMPGSYTFSTDDAEHMEIIAGNVEVEIKGEEGNVEYIKGGEYFEVPANSSFDIKVNEPTDYCCTYIK
ncbi:Pyrimidine/purine nucleoside phosphorylase like protein [Aduncisulcus paluster]|uniref:Pyrimidine/purine nucleoside phosphorylase like protein n=1 Tax=Aduncisulcus paluster TaxID=2918883 RepID=A0ABQ5KDR5_9EUKA|nr:Pyrimidine/purine nucleoside phosphorylase like protein [Aduncisulcus paluster]